MRAGAPGYVSRAGWTLAWRASSSMRMRKTYVQKLPVDSRRRRSAIRHLSQPFARPRSPPPRLLAHLPSPSPLARLAPHSRTLSRAYTLPSSDQCAFFSGLDIGGSSVSSNFGAPGTNRFSARICWRLCLAVSRSVSISAGSVTDALLRYSSLERRARGLRGQRGRRGLGRGRGLRMA